MAFNSAESTGSLEPMTTAGANELWFCKEDVCETLGKSCRKLISPTMGRLSSLAGIINAGLLFATTGSACKDVKNCVRRGKLRKTERHHSRALTSLKLSRMTPAESHSSSSAAVFILRLVLS